MTRFFGVGLVASVLVLAAACSKYEPPEVPAKPGPAAEGASILRLDPALDAVIPPGAVVEKVAGGLGFVEGPVWTHNTLWFSDLTGNRLYVLGYDGAKRMILDKSGGKDDPPAGSYQGSNGAVVDKDGTVLLTQHGARRIVRVTDNMKVIPVLDRFQGKRFNSPNDLAFAPDGALWFTDPPYGLVGQDQDPAKEIPFNAVYRYANGQPKAVITDLPRPNGIGFSPDGKTLYVSNSEPEMYVNAYDVGPDGAVSNPRRFISYPAPNPVDVPDGLKVDGQGNVWTSGPGGIRIVSPNGKVLGQIKTSDSAQANLAWGGPGFRTVYILASANVYRIKLAIPGEKPLYTN